MTWMIEGTPMLGNNQTYYIYIYIFWFCNIAIEAMAHAQMIYDDLSLSVEVCDFFLFVAPNNKMVYNKMVYVTNKNHLRFNHKKTNQVFFAKLRENPFHP